MITLRPYKFLEPVPKCSLQNITTYPATKSAQNLAYKPDLKKKGKEKNAGLCEYSGQNDEKFSFASENKKILETNEPREGSTIIYLSSPSAKLSDEF